jgi:hypothetical protein
MAAINPPGFLHNVSTHTALTNRHSSGAGLLLPDAVGSLRSVGGTRTPTDLVVTYLSGTDVSLSAGLAYVPQAQNPIGGTYVVANDGAITFTLGARHATLNRYDLIVARVQDSFYSGSNNTSDFIVIGGTAASTPVDPSLPAGASYLVLARVTVPPSGALTVTRLAKHIQIAGNIPSVDASDVVNGTYIGQYRDHPVQGLQRWDGATWQPSTQQGMARAMIYSSVSSGVYSATTWSNFTLDLETIDTHSGHAGGAGGYTVPTGQAGTYLVEGLATFQGLANPATFATRIAVNGNAPGAFGHGQYNQSTPGGQGAVTTGLKLLTLAVGDVVTVQGYGGSIWQSIVASGSSLAPQMSIVRIA